MTIAVALILIGLALIIAEVIFIPGTTLAGFAGAASAGAPAGKT